MIRQFDAGVTLLGGGPWREEDLEAALVRAPYLVCADGAANALSAHEPDLIIGDLDSLDDRAGWTARLGDRVLHDPDQDTTDFQKCLLHVQAPFVIGVGFLGGRLDHELAVLSALATAVIPLVLLGDEDVVFAGGGNVRVPSAPGQRVSIFPMASITGRSEGLKWPIDGLVLAPDGQIATSNEATASEVKLDFDRPKGDAFGGSGASGALVILPRSEMGAALIALGVGGS